MTRTEYLRDLNDARDDKSKWTHQAGISRLVIGELTIEVTYSPRVTTWELLDGGGDTVNHGSSETKELAQA